MMSDDDKKRARARAARLIKKFEELLRRVEDANPGADRARLKRRFIDAVVADPVLGEAAIQAGFRDAFDEIRRRERDRAGKG
jgi:hypothetical protein